MAKVHICTESDGLSIETAQCMLDGIKLIALDCEGVQLSRVGEITIVSIGVSSEQVILFDMKGLLGSSKITKIIKEVLEDDTVEKIIHDCRMDSDALLHKLDIILTNVHDTQCWHMEKNRNMPKHPNLNESLLAFGCKVNAERDRSVYRINYRFWDERPLTTRMIQWATDDVSNLFELYEKQKSDLASAEFYTRAEESSMANCKSLRTWLSKIVEIKRSKIGLFIGKNGSNVKELQTRLGVRIQVIGAKESRTFVVYAPNQQVMNRMESTISSFV